MRVVAVVGGKGGVGKTTTATTLICGASIPRPAGGRKGACNSVPL